MFCFKQLFYQVKGDMCLKVIVNGKHKDVHIREGEVSLHTVFISFSSCLYVRINFGLGMLF